MDNKTEPFCPDCREGRGEAHFDGCQVKVSPCCWEEHLQGRCFRDFYWDGVAGAAAERNPIRIGSVGKSMKPSRYTLQYGEMIAGQDGLYRLGSVMDIGAESKPMTGHPFHSPEEAVAAFTHMMNHQGYDVYDLPVTARTHGWCCGLVFSVTPRSDGESRVYGVMLAEWECHAPA